MNKKQLRASFLLLLCAFIWGSTFVAQSEAAKSIPPFTFLAARSFVGAFALWIISRIFSRKSKESRQQPFLRNRKLLVAGFLCGTALAVASACQQYGITLGTGAGKAGFLTALYLVFVPLLNFLFYRKNPGIFALFGALFALCGLFLLCGVASDGHFTSGDLITAGCGLCFAVHILIIDQVAPTLDGIQLSCVQFFVCGCLSLAMALVLEGQAFLHLGSAFGSVLYAGLFSSALAYTLQIYGQKDCPPAVATVLMSLESVFALGSEAVVAQFTHTAFSFHATELFGCLLMFVGVLLAQNPLRSKEK